MSETGKLYLYLHTHWDREWYLTHEEYRSQLFFVVEDLVGKMERNALECFFLDGQTCLLEDLAEVDPQLLERVKKLVHAGSLEIGPWYVLADQMLVGGESLLRNLEMGLSQARLYGPPAMIGYCPDTFGHSQDLPRILQNFAISNCFLWRGLPDLCPSNLFWWTSPDGSKVLGYHLARGYFQSFFHEKHTAEKLAEFLLSWLPGCPQEGEAMVEANLARSLSRPFQSVLIPVGADHLAAPSGFKRQLEAARLLLKIENVAQAVASEPSKESSKKSAQPSRSLAVEATTLSSFAEVMQNYAVSKASVILTITGELRDNALAKRYNRAFMLPGVLSSRLYLKRLNRLAERRLVRLVEPVFTFLHCSSIFKYPQAPLHFAWRTLLRNQPHDSICGCSVDAVHRQMLSRFQTFDSVLNVLERKAFEALAAGFSLPGPQTASPALDFSPGDDIECGAGDFLPPGQGQAEKGKAGGRKKAGPAPGSVAESLLQPIYNMNYKLNYEEEIPSAKALAAVGQPCLVDPEFPVTHLILSNLSGESTVGPMRIAWCEPMPANAAAASDQASVYGHADGTTWQVESASERTLIFTCTNHAPETKSVCVYEGWVWSDRVPAHGWQSIAWPAKSARLAGPKLLRANDDDASGEQTRIANEFFTVEIGRDGAVVATGKDSRKRARVFEIGHHIRDLGDGGDSYNFDPISGDQPLTARLTNVALGAQGPLVASLLLTYELNIPEGMVELKEGGLAGGKGHERGGYVRSEQLLLHQFVTKIELHKSVPIIFFETTWENKARNHRLEVVFDTGLTVEKTLSENHFSIVERPHSVKKISLPVAAETEAPLDRYPCQRFFIANRQVFFNTGLPEYGVAGASVQVTILRAVSHLSRDDLLSRGAGAGPPVLTDEANCLGLNKVNYGWAPLPGDWGSEAQTKSVSKMDKDKEKGAEPLAVLANFAKISAPKKEAGGLAGEASENQSQSTVFDRLTSALPIGLTAWRALDADVINAYRLAELYEGLFWCCLTSDSGKVERKSFVEIDNPAVRIMALRTLAGNEMVELRLLNVLLTSQAAELHVQIAHVEAQMTMADGRIVELLERVDDLASQKGEAKVQPIRQAKGGGKKREDTSAQRVDMLALWQSARYRLELGPNALISIRLKLSARGPEKHQSKRKGGS